MQNNCVINSRERIINTNNFARSYGALQFENLLKTIIETPKQKWKNTIEMFVNIFHKVNF